MQKIIEKQQPKINKIKAMSRFVMVIIVGNEHGDTSSNPVQDFTSHIANTFGKGMNPTILLPVMG